MSKDICDTDLHNQIIAMDNTLAKKSTSFTAEEQRLFYLTLASIKPDQKTCEVAVEKKALIDMLGFTSRDAYSRIRPMFLKLMKHSLICYGDDEDFDDGFLITRIRTTKRSVYVTFGEQYMPLLIELAPGFTRMLSDDAIKFRSKYSMLLYQNLMRLNNKGRDGIDWSTRELKEMFGLGKDDYVYNGVFNRKLFETYTVDLAVREINALSKCISNLRYEKQKLGYRVQCYVFRFEYIDPKTFKEPIDVAVEHRKALKEKYTPEELESLRREIELALSEK